MKAIRAHAFGGPETLVLDEIPAPEPGPGQVLIEMKAAGVNPADTYMLTGNYAITPDLPYIPGGDCAGVVATVGPQVEKFAPGDRVFVSAALGRDLSGCYAEYVLRPAENILPLPENVGFAEAAAIGVPYVTAHLALFTRGRAQAGETVFIHGASGAVGTAAIQLAHRAGMRAIGSAGSAAGLDLVRAQGAEVAVDHSRPGYLDQVRSATGGEGPALILEMLANANLAADMDLAAPFGRIVIVGCRGEIVISPRVAMMKELDIAGTAVWNAPRTRVLDTLADIGAGLADGSLRPVVNRTYPLAEAAEAQRDVLRPGARGKVVLTGRMIT
ncbi:NADPH:quinone reductase [Ruegeria marina]|uniref:NADPH2:quinone reductase n=1 Tax=Ruegeria marina TaxID=639004 RepID=A0A1G6TEZ5_9RHOB|nr:NADPH:quinone reductase [Ruegeria marina]SDD26885.1 NADPH2:quinone reductase [Ruegeria marina]